MKHFITSQTGGLPIVLDDLRFIESAYVEAIKASISPFVPASNILILSGCKVTQTGSPVTNISISAGYIYYLGEIYYLNGASFSFDVNKSINLSIQTSYDPAGFKTFQSTVQHDTYQVQELVASYDLVPPANSFVFPTASVYSEIYSEMKSHITTVNVSNQNIAIGNIYPGVYNVVCTTDFSGIKNLQGRRWYEDPSLDDVLFTIPTSLAPSSRILITVPNENYMLLTLSIETNGNVLFKSSLPSIDFTNVISFDNIRYK